MPEHSSMHIYLNWTKERLDEMDAALASLEASDCSLPWPCSTGCPCLITPTNQLRASIRSPATLSGAR